VAQHILELVRATALDLDAVDDQVIVYAVQACDSCGGRLGIFSSKELRDAAKQRFGFCSVTYDVILNDENGEQQNESR
jgi:predicted metal-binding protein